MPVNINQKSEKTRVMRDAINRRDVLKIGAATFATTVVSTQSSLGVDNVSDGYIDCHSHVWSPDVEKYPLAGDQTVEDLKPRSFTPEELMETASPHGVSRVVLIQHTVYHSKDNTYLIDTIAEHPGRFSGVSWIEPARENVTETMDELLQAGFRGCRIRPGDGGVDRWRDSSGMNKMWSHGAKIGVAMCPLINPEYLSEVIHMCEKHQETTVVIDHFARVGIDGTIHRKDLDKLLRLAKFPKTHVKVSAYYALGDKRPPHNELVPMIKELYDAFGPQRLMWGSDCPYQIVTPNTYAASINLIKNRIDFLTADDKDWLLKKTAEKIFFPS